MCLLCLAILIFLTCRINHPINGKSVIIMEKFAKNVAFTYITDPFAGKFHAHVVSC